jgi:hypothetical protein
MARRGVAGEAVGGGRSAAVHWTPNPLRGPRELPKSISGSGRALDERCDAIKSVVFEHEAGRHERFIRK